MSTHREVCVVRVVPVALEAMVTLEDDDGMNVASHASFPQIGVVVGILALTMIGLDGARCAPPPLTVVASALGVVVFGIDARVLVVVVVETLLLAVIAASILWETSVVLVVLELLVAATDAIMLWETGEMLVLVLVMLRTLLATGIDAAF